MSQRTPARPWRALLARLDAHPSCPRRVLDGVLDEVPEHLEDARLVHEHGTVGRLTAESHRDAGLPREVGAGTDRLPPPPTRPGAA